MRIGRCSRCKVSSPEAGALLCAVCDRYADVPMRLTVFPPQERPVPRYRILSHRQMTDVLLQTQEPAEEPTISRRTKHRKAA